ncbi:Alpha-L-fucosidase [Posidoniimonas polymericola]|uniref:alpha-L-fucosidase n=1 Tax=Posidoniimonas polymericola TaxID=2528002 RepID=A0A5C5ZFE5_9BACT|nr:alpha-L-fucosidase [Posidoniimonas polymericola]TWT85835.1 Alpha-L-fucosidase [Posidoniimonas polymericola]
MKLLASIALTLLLTCSTGVSLAEEKYEPTWESLRRHTPAPEWFRDAKFGVYFHWGVYSVPAYSNEWYPRNMHLTDTDVYRRHRDKYGEPTDYPYDKFVDDFTAEHFDADAWVELFEQAGAKFVGPVAEHHDGFAMWDSELTPWNAADRGPHRDIMGQVAAAARSRGMKVVATFHHARNNLWQKKAGDPGSWTGHYDGAKRNFPSVLEDPDRAFLYGYMPRDKFLDLWLGKLTEVIDNYSPDLIWFDSWLDEIPEEQRQEFLAYYFNHAAEHGQQVLVTYKQEDMPQDVCVLDLEKGGMDKQTDFTWLTDDTISLGSWCYTDNLRVKPTRVVLHSLIDIVSKNGQLLLNVSPTADGVIPDDQRKVLLELGEWLGQYGEAIYSTRPFTTYGHGPTTAGKGHFGGIALDQGYTAQDVRYTQHGDVVYALVLGWPGAGAKTLLEGFAGDGSRVTGVELLGSDAKIAFEQTDDGVSVTAPEAAPNELAVVYKLTVEK